MSALDKPLGEIISEKRKERRPAQKKRKRSPARRREERMAPAVEGKPKVKVSNLRFEVDSVDLKDVLRDVRGLLSADVQYKNNGKSAGEAILLFKTLRAAQAFVREYDEVPLDGRPMRCSLLGARLGSVKEHVEKKKTKPVKEKKEKREKKEVTAEDLDAEMDAFFSKE